MSKRNEAYQAWYWTNQIQDFLMRRLSPPVDKRSKAAKLRDKANAAYIKARKAGATPEQARMSRRLYLLGKGARL